AGGGDQRQRREAAAIAYGKLCGDPTAQRMAHEVHALRSEPVEKVEIVHGDVPDIPDPGRVVGLAEAGMLGNDHFEFLCQPGKERQPARIASGPVQVDERGTASVPPQADSDVAHLVRLLLSGHQLPRSTFLWMPAPAGAGRRWGLRCSPYSVCKERNIG